MDKEESHDKPVQGEESHWARHYLFYLIALLIVALMVFGLFPYYYVKDDPQPSAIPEIDKVISGKITLDTNITKSRDDFNLFISPDDPVIKQAATFIATYGCDSSKICQAKAEYYFVRDRFDYVSEYDEYVQSAREMLVTRGGDCDDHAVLLLNLMLAIGIPAKFVPVPGHVYIKIHLDDAPRKYLDSEGWISLDPTCKSCDFGEISAKYTS